jgi:hypothetical protein
MSEIFIIGSRWIMTDYPAGFIFKVVGEAVDATGLKIIFDTPEPDQTMTRSEAWAVQNMQPAAA